MNSQSLIKKFRNWVYGLLMLNLTNIKNLYTTDKTHFTLELILKLLRWSLCEDHATILTSTFSMEIQQFPI